MIRLRLANAISAAKKAKISGMSRSHIKRQVEVATLGMQTIKNAHIASQEEEGCNKKFWRFCSSHIASINKLIMT